MQETTGVQRLCLRSREKRRPDPTRRDTHHRRFLVDLGSQILLTHALSLIVLLVLSSLGDGRTHRGGDGRGGFDLVLHVELGDPLVVGGCNESRSHEEKKEEGGEER